MLPALPKLIREQMENNSFWKCTFWELGAAEQGKCNPEALQGLLGAQVKGMVLKDCWKEKILVC